MPRSITHLPTHLLLLLLGAHTLGCTAATDRAPAPVHGRVVSVGGEQVHVVERGRGPAVVVIHGNPGTAAEADYYLLPVLAARFRVVAWDRPGHGASSRHDAKLADPFAQAELLHRGLAALGVAKPVLISHSWGTAVALAFAQTFPTETAGLVLTAPMYEPSGRTAWLQLPGLSWALAHLLPRPLAVALTRRGLEQAFAPERMPAPYWAMVQQQWLTTMQLHATLDDANALAAAMATIRERLDTVQMPVALVAGGSDAGAAPARHANRLARALPQSRLTVLPDAGHQVPYLHPEAVREATDWVVGQKASRWR